MNLVVTLKQIVSRLIHNKKQLQHNSQISSVTMSHFVSPHYRTFGILLLSVILSACGNSGQDSASSIAINNSAPTASSVSITDDNGGSSTVVGDSLTGSYTYGDVDGDSEGTSTFRWLRDGTAISGAIASIYTVVSVDSGTSITFEVTLIAATGTITGGAVTSSGMTILLTDAWTWVSGSNTVYQSGTYGTKGTAASGNVPGTRQYSISWKDGSGNLWMFGGWGYDNAGTVGHLNDLWKYDGSNWTWVSGSNTVYQSGTYGTKGTAASGNVPGARQFSISWRDGSGNLWMFGGYGYSSVGMSDGLNDLWKYDGSNWTWVSGSNTGNQFGTYGTKGTAASGNVPGARQDSISWTDGSGNLWLFGGYGNDSAASLRYLNDLWKFDGSNWTWVSGSNTGNQFGTYGTKGTAASGNVPGARRYSTSWTDGSGNLWLFGGAGYDSAGPLGFLNDLWKYDGSNWTWVSGSNTSNQFGTYGTKGTAASGNVPGARRHSLSWRDGSGNLWMFGGRGYDSAGTLDRLNDLWKYDGSNWTWVTGSNTGNQSGTYGTQGTAASGNVPGARSDSISWRDGSGNLWMFGGFGRDSAGSSGSLNDLWRYQPKK